MGFQLVSTVGSLDEGIAGRGGCCSCFSMLGWPWWMLQLLQYAWVAMVAFRMRLLINVIGFLILWDITWLLGAGFVLNSRVFLCVFVRFPAIPEDVWSLMLWVFLTRDVLIESWNISVWYWNIQNSVEFRNSIQALQGSKDEFSAHEYSKEKNTAKKKESISNCLVRRN